MPVAPFGAPFNIEEWDEFHRVTGIPVVIDAAAGFDTASAGLSPVMISLHATKAMGIGEGGLILCRDNNLAEQIRAARNFGFLGERVAEIPGMNAKLSEYGAAVGLARSMAGLIGGHSCAESPLIISTSLRGSSICDLRRDLVLTMR